MTTWKVQWIAPSHCTGEPAFAVFKESFGDHYMYAGLGTTMELGPTISTKAEIGNRGPLPWMLTTLPTTASASSLPTTNLLSR